MNVRLVSLFICAVLLTGPAHAWSRPGHMVSAEIAWVTLEKDHPEVLDQLAVLLDAHPDKGPFEIAIDRETGRERTRRMFHECARWPDDIRGTDQDRPSWHGALRPVVAPDLPPALKPNDAVSGGALLALDLNYSVLANPRATHEERALALCWVMHVAGDIHQPLHTAELFSTKYPGGDGGGGRQHVRDPLTGEPVSLHWLWDDSVHRSGVTASVKARAAELMAAHPSATASGSGQTSGWPEFRLWAETESYNLAVTSVYTANLKASPYPLEAPVAPAAYWQTVKSVSEERISLAGYRLAGLLQHALGGQVLSKK